VIGKAAILTGVIGVGLLFGLAASSCRSSRAADAGAPLPAAGAVDASKDAAMDATTDASTRSAADGGAAPNRPRVPARAHPIRSTSAHAPRRRARASHPASLVVVA
jgi:hypothetical protein